MKPLLYLLVPLMLSSSLTFASSCNNFESGVTVCTGPDNFSSVQHNYNGGVSIYEDNRGNSASIHRYQGGATVIVPHSTGRPSPGFVPPGMGTPPGYGPMYDR
ncbi:hypothetical protein SAMN05216387_12112 [Nitrosovibrio tenuis]|uniref:PXPV repeat-containing protein n=1 Tax=Nitrosovibrio tenuis TaxID=1233 RepID=A0A1H7RWZ2_9PROT|nr:hypothetical protein SAMN05216387_12112 [Nitrosovibrio tenuis]